MGVIGFTRALSATLGDAGITVNVVAPGMVDTDMIATLGDQRVEQRGRKRETPLGDSEKSVEKMASLDPDAVNALHGSQVGALLEPLIAALPEKLREPLLLSAVEEMSPREVAATLEITEAAVRSRVFRARQILKGKLAERMDRK